MLSSHGVSEVRQELTLYEENPAGYALEQRQRSVDVLLRDLKVALKDRDHDLADSLMTWLQTLAPLDKRLRGITGVYERPMIRWDRVPRIALWIGLGAIGGLLLGAFIAAAFDLRAFMPSGFIRASDALVQWLGPRGR